MSAGCAGRRGHRLDTAATAKALDMAPGTITAHLSRAVATLRGHLVINHNLEGGS